MDSYVHVVRRSGADTILGAFASEEVAAQAAVGVDADGQDGVVDAIPVYDSFEGWLSAADDTTREQHLSRLRILRDRLNVLLGETVRDDD